MGPSSTGERDFFFLFSGLVLSPNVRDGGGSLQPLTPARLFRRHTHPSHSVVPSTSLHPPHLPTPYGFIIYMRPLLDKSIIPFDPSVFLSFFSPCFFVVVLLSTPPSLPRSLSLCLCLSHARRLHPSKPFFWSIMSLVQHLYIT